MRASVTSDCPNDCSGHGVCVSSELLSIFLSIFFFFCLFFSFPSSSFSSLHFLIYLSFPSSFNSSSPPASGTCRCSDGYTGADCSTPIATMKNATKYPGTVEQRQWRYYAFHNTLNTLVLSLNQTTPDPSQDCDLYVKYSALPNLTYFDYRDTTMSQNIQLKVSEAKIGDYYIGVYGFKACTYMIAALSVNACPNQCSGASHGVCTSTTSCRCTSRFSGTACETMVSALGYDAPITGYVGSNFWNYCESRGREGEKRERERNCACDFLKSPLSSLFQTISARTLPTTSTSHSNRTQQRWTAICT